MRSQLFPFPARLPNASPADQKTTAKTITGNDTNSFPKYLLFGIIGEIVRNNKRIGNATEPAA